MTLQQNQSNLWKKQKGDKNKSKIQIYRNLV